MVPPLFLVKARAKGSTYTPSEVNRSGGVVKMNTETDQGISTSGSSGGQFHMISDDSSSCSGSSHNSTHRLNKTSVSVYKKSKEVPKLTSSFEKCA